MIQIPSDRKMVSERTSFLFAVVLLVALSLWPVWSVRFLPMQDYPQHLFIAFVAATFDDPYLTWDRFYQATSAVGPYRLSYLIVHIFALWFEIETAGKLLVSLVVLLTALVVIRESAHHETGASPWGLLLLFPFMFSQIYYLGFQGYLLSLPILFLALRDLETFTARPLTASSAARHLALQVLLFLAHPYTVLVYLGLAAAALPFALRRRDALARAVVAPLILGLAFFAWYLAAPSPENLPQGAGWSVRWWPFVEGTLGFISLMFTGMGLSEGVSWLHSLLWLTLGILFFASGVVHRKRFDVPVKARVFLYLTLALLAALPFWFGYYAYFGQRLAPVAYGLLALVLAHVPLHRIGGAFCVVALAGLLLLTGRTHERLSAETATLLPVLAEMDPGATVLPLYADARSQVLDPRFFEQFHAHDHYYYHLLIGGGFSPTLFPNAMLPVQYRAGLSLPQATDLRQFRWESYAPYYRYVLVRGASPAFIADMRRTTELTARYGPWTLFKNPRQRAPY